MNSWNSDDLVALLPRLRRFAYGLAGSVEDADDLVQGACERAISRRHQWRPGTRLDSWMFRIVQNLHIDQGRSRQTRRAHLELVASEPPSHVDGLGATESHLTLARARDVISGLPDEQRAVLLLVSVEGATYREASDILQIPVGTVMSRLSRARAALVNAMKGGAASEGAALNQAEG